MPEPLHNSNFTFLAEHDARLAKIGYEAEQLATISPTACMMQVRMLAELMAKETAAYLGVYGIEDSTFYQILVRLERESAFHRDIRTLFHSLRTSANPVVHGEVYLGNAVGVAKKYLRITRKIAIWFHQSFGRDPGFRPGEFIDPPDLASQRESILEQNQDLQDAVRDSKHAVEEANRRALDEKRRRATAEEFLAQVQEELTIYRSIAEDYEARLIELQASSEAAGEVGREEHQERMLEATALVELDEQETRTIIDAQLRECGWRVDSEELRWGQGARPQAGEQMAIAEVPTSSGPADYVLFDGLMPLAIIEAKRWEEPIIGGIEQAKRYSLDYALTEEQESPGGPWLIDDLEYQIPFVFASNGRAYLEQNKTHCGVWFQDLRREINRSRALLGWYTPRGLRNLLKNDTDKALAMLREEPFDYLGLRYYQREAVEAIERAIAQGRRTALLAMATGTGKTRTAIGMVYRMVKSGLFNRILFLVDRTSLGDQAFAAFQTTKLESHRSFTETYDAKSLDESTIEVDTRLSIATVQSIGLPTLRRRPRRRQ